MKLLTILFISFLLNPIGKTQEEVVRKIGFFDKLEASGIFEIRLQEGAKEELKLVSATNEDSLITTEIVANKLIVKSRKGIFEKTDVIVYIIYTKMKEITAKNKVTIFNKSTIKSNELRLYSSVSSKIQTEMDVTSLYVKANKGSDIDLYGYCNYQDLIINSKSTFIGYRLEAEETYIKVSTGGIANVYTTKKLIANARTGGKIMFKGEPKKIEKKLSLGGQIINEDL